MNVYDFAPDGVRGIEGSDGIVYAKVVSCIGIRDYSCERCIFYDYNKDKCLLSRSNSCMEGCHRGGVGGALG